MLMYGPGLGLVGAIAIGVPVAVAAGCMGKALEIGVTLRVAPRQRGAVTGLMSWPGNAWLWLGLFLGLRPNGDFSFGLGMVTCWIVTVLLLAAAVWLSVWGTQKGLAGGGATDARPAAPKKGARFGREPLYRKELLWFVRDRSAIVQTILVLLTVAGVQVFNHAVRRSWRRESGTT